MLQRYRKAIRSPSQFSELAIVGTFPLQSRTNGLHITKSRYGEAWNSLIRARCATLCDGQPLTQCDHSRVTIGGCGGPAMGPAPLRQCRKQVANTDIDYEILIGSISGAFACSRQPIDRRYSRHVGRLYDIAGSSWRRATCSGDDAGHYSGNQMASIDTNSLGAGQRTRSREPGVPIADEGRSWSFPAASQFPSSCSRASRTSAIFPVSVPAPKMLFASASSSSVTGRFASCSSAETRAVSLSAGSVGTAVTPY